MDDPIAVDDLDDLPTRLLAAGFQQVTRLGIPGWLTPQGAWVGDEAEALELLRRLEGRKP